MGHVDPVGVSKPQPKVLPFGKYLLLDRIAVGGMAEVYTAKSFGIEGFEKIIACKRILPTMAEDADFITMFIDEAKIAGHLTHANIVPIYELGKIGESHYIAMEYVWGKDLLQIMNRFRRMRRHMPPVMAAWIASKMLEGLDYSHRKRDRHGRPMGIIHRDVSPQNCLVSYEGQVKMIDFGIAKAASRNTKTQAGVLKGKFGYMSPEQVRGNPIDHRSDIFASTTCLHEMLTGERLFVGESDFSTLEKVRNADAPPPSSIISDMPAELERIVLKGLAREPDERWQTAGEMQEELQRYIALSRPPFGTSKLNTWMRTAFAPEIAKEKARLDSFSKVTHPGASPQPRAPASPGRPPPSPSATGSDFGAIEDEDEFGGGEATMITASPFDAMLEAQQGFQELTEEPTQIFFSADDLEEIHDDGTPAGSLAPPSALGPHAVQPLGPPPGPRPLPAGQMPPRPMLGAAAVAPAPTPMAQAGRSVHGTMQMPAHPGGDDMFAQPPGPPKRQRNLETIEVRSPGNVAVPAKRSGTGKWIALGGVAALLLIIVGVGVALLAVGGETTGTISVRVSPESAAALVFVDGLRSGQAPLQLEHVPEGDHAIEVRAEGYQTANRIVPVNAGSTAMLEIALTPAVATANTPAVAAAPPRTPIPAAPGTPSAPVAAAGAPSAPVAAADPTPAPAPTPAAPAQPMARAPRPAAVAANNVQPPRTPAATPTPRTTPRGAPTREPTRTQPRRIPREPRTPRTRPPRPARAPAGGGTLTINTMPWARVFLDGRDTGRNTPVRDLPVSAGAHTVGLRTNDGTMHTVRVTVEAGESARIVRQL